MPKLYNTVTKQFMFMPDSYIGQAPFITEDEAAKLAQPIVVEVEQPAKPAKKKATYNATATDADGDGRVQDGTPFEREAGTELSPEEVTAIEATISEE
jgi:hypothetical protein